MNHELKVRSEYYQAIANKIKTFEVRKNDRDFKVGDYLILEEWDPETKKYTGNRMDASIDYILRDGEFGIKKDYVVMSITVIATRKVYK